MNRKKDPLRTNHGLDQPTRSWPRASQPIRDQPRASQPIGDQPRCGEPTRGWLGKPFPAFLLPPMAAVNRLVLPPFLNNYEEANGGLRGRGTDQKVSA